jgi:hypothetical protein
MYPINILYAHTSHCGSVGGLKQTRPAGRQILTGLFCRHSLASRHLGRADEWEHSLPHRPAWP